MATITVAPEVLKNVELLIPTDDYREHVSSVTFTPTTRTIQWTGLGTNTYTAASKATWTVELAYAQDWTTTNSLSSYLLEHEGEKVEITFAPADGGDQFTATVYIVPGAIGGAVNTVGVGTVTLPVVGAPERVPAA